MSPELEYAEEWRQVVGFEGFYEVSNLGRVRSLARTVQHRTWKGNPGTQFIPGGLVRPRLRKGYLAVGLHVGGKSQTINVHAVVAAAFIGKRPPGKQVDHKDGVKTNNAAHNLDYKTGLQNMRAAKERGANMWHPGEGNHAAKLSQSDIIEIRRLYKEGMYQKDIGKMFGVHQAHISKIILNKNWRVSES
jgi:hypothetical protein